MPRIKSLLENHLTVIWICQERFLRLKVQRQEPLSVCQLNKPEALKEGFSSKEPQLTRKLMVKESTRCQSSLTTFWRILLPTHQVVLTRKLKSLQKPRKDQAQPPCLRQETVSPASKMERGFARLQT